MNHRYSSNIASPQSGCSDKPHDSSVANGMPSRLSLFNDLFGVRFGSLWWAREDLLAERAPGWVARSDRTGHPVIVLATHPAHSLDDRIPLLVGTSQTHANDFRFDVTGDGHATFFSLSLVAWATPRDFLWIDRSAVHGIPEGHSWDIAKLWPNQCRGTLSGAESIDLREAWKDWPHLVA